MAFIAVTEASVLLQLYLPLTVGYDAKDVGNFVTVNSLSRVFGLFVQIHFI